MTRPTQMPLDLGGTPAYSAADFLIADSNREALSRIEHWVDWPFFAHAVVGPEGSGKTHLVHLFAAAAGAVIVPARTLSIDRVPELAEARTLALEDADRGVDEAALFHLFNLVREKSGALLLTGREPPSRWPIALPDLRSRLALVPVTAIRPPDDALLAALMVKLFADRQIRIGPDLPAYIVPRIERSFAAIRKTVELLDRAALAAGRPVTVPLARDILSATRDLLDE